MSTPSGVSMHLKVFQDYTCACESLRILKKEWREKKMRQVRKWSGYYTEIWWNFKPMASIIKDTNLYLQSSDILLKCISYASIIMFINNK